MSQVYRCLRHHIRFLDTIPFKFGWPKAQKSVKLGIRAGSNEMYGLVLVHTSTHVLVFIKIISMWVLIRVSNSLKLIQAGKPIARDPHTPLTRHQSNYSNLIHSEFQREHDYPSCALHNNPWFPRNQRSPNISSHKVTRKYFPSRDSNRESSASFFLIVRPHSDRVSMLFICRSLDSYEYEILAHYFHLNPRFKYQLTRLGEF